MVGMSLPLQFIRISSGMPISAISFLQPGFLLLKEQVRFQLKIKYQRFNATGRPFD
jgi:hypothetical protein